LFLSKPFFPLNVSSVFSLVSTFGPLLFHDVSLLRSHLSFSLITVSLSLGPPHFLFQMKTFQLPSSPPFFLSCTPSVFIGRGSEGHPALPSHGRAWWHAWGRILHSRPCLCRAWPFWREGVVVSVKGQVRGVGFLGFGRERKDKKMGGKMLLLPLFSACPGEEEGLWCRSKRHCLLPLFFFSVKRMKRRRFDQNTSFHLNENWRLKRVQFQISPSLCALFHYGPWFWISSIESLIGHQTSIYMQLSP